MPVCYLILYIPTYLLCTLEELNEEKQLKSKADIFTKRTIKPHEVVTSVDMPSGAPPKMKSSFIGIGGKCSNKQKHKIPPAGGIFVLSLS